LAAASVVVGASTASAAPAPQGVCVNIGIIVRLGLGPGGPPTCALGEIKVCLGPISSPGCDAAPLPSTG
jgi:hypothetical protein